MADQKFINRVKLYGPLVLSQITGKGLGALKDLLIASFLGISAYTDAYFLFLAIPGYLVTLFASPIISLLVPELARVGSENRVGHAFGYLKFFVKFSLVTTFSLFVGGFVYLTSKGGTSNFEWFCFLLMCSVLPFSCSGQVLVSYLSLKKDYKKLAVLTVINAVVSFVTFLILVGRIEHWALPISFLSGFVVEGSVAFFFLKLKTVSGPIKKNFSLFQNFFKEYSALIFSAVFLGSATLVDNLMISGLGEEGGVTSYSFGIKFVAVFLSLSLFPINQVVFPKLSRLYADHQTLIKFRSFYLVALVSVFCYGLLAVFGFGLFGEMVLEIFYLRGKITQEDMELINKVLSFYSIQIPFYLAGVLAAKVLSVMRLNRFLLVISIGSLALNIVLNFLFIEVLGVAGVALSTSVVYFYSFVFMMVVFLIKFQKNKSVEADYEK